MKNEKNRKLHGSVLLTVVVVMSLLIVFLFGTLALATAANNRAHVNYSSSQTGVTSRMVAQSAVNAMDASLTYRQAIGNIKPGDAPLDVSVTIGNPSAFNSGALGDIAPVQVEYAGKKKVLRTDPATKKQEWVDNDLLKFTASVTMGGVESKTSAYVLKLTESGTTNSSKGMGFRTTGDASFSCQTSLYGGAYINLPKDNYKYYDEKLPSGEVVKPSFSGTPMTFNNSGAIAEADLYVNNNVKIENWSGFIFPDKGTGVTIWGNLEYGNNVKDSDKCQFEAKEGIDFSNLKFNEIPYLYVDGQIIYGNAFKAGSSNSTLAFPLNVFCGSMECTDGNGAALFETCADIYCMDDGKTSELEAMNFGDSKLYSWAGSVINQAESTAAQPHAQSVYSKGNLKLKNMEIAGDVSCEGWCEINGKVVIHGNLTVKGNLKVNGANLQVDGEIICGTHEGIADDKISSSGKKATLKPGYEKINTFNHDGKVNAFNSIEVKNEKIPYLVLDPANYHYTNPETGIEEGYSDLFGNPLGSDPTKLVYTWREDLTYEQISGILALGTQTTEDIAKIDPSATDAEAQRLQCWRNFYDAAAPLVDPAKAPFTEAEYPDGETTYTVKTYYDIATATTSYGTVPTTEEYSHYDPVTGVEVFDGEPYKTLPMWSVADGKYVDSNTKTDLDYVYASTTNPGVWVPEDEAVKTGEYYPQYAEREVLLGLKQVDNPASAGKLSKESTQVVQTIQELYDSGYSPYTAENSGLPTEFTGTYAGLPAYNLSNGDDVNKLIAASGNNYVKSIGGAGNDLYKIELDNQENKNNLAALYITKSCKLSGSFGSDGKDVVIDPNGNHILIAFEDCSFGAGCDIIVDDSKGGDVTFFIEDNKTLTLNGEAMYATISYMNLLKHFNGKEIQLANVYDESGVKDANYVVKDAGGNPLPDITEDILDGDLAWLKDRLVPALTIRSGDNAKLNIGNFKLLTANIISSGLEFNLSATSTPLFKPSKFYYNGTNVYKPMTNGTTDSEQIIFGCVNTNKASLPNKVQIIFADDGSGGKKPPKTPGDFEYTIMYYDEY